MEYSYPLYKQNPDKSTIVKFTRLSTGTILFESQYPDRVGKTITDLIDHTDTHFWTTVPNPNLREFYL